VPASKTLPPGISTGITPSDVEDLAMQHFGPFSVAIAFRVFLTVAAVAGIVADDEKRGLALARCRGNP
jgi:hypothetical protein